MRLGRCGKNICKVLLETHPGLIFLQYINGIGGTIVLHAILCFICKILLENPNVRGLVYPSLRCTSSTVCARRVKYCNIFCL